MHKFNYVSLTLIERNGQLLFFKEVWDQENDSEPRRLIAKVAADKAFILEGCVYDALLNEELLSEGWAIKPEFEEELDHITLVEMFGLLNQWKSINEQEE